MNPHPKQEVDWYLYAEKYDMLLGYNPFYQNLQQEILNITRGWPIEPDERLVDIGAGTGNYSIPLAKQFPKAHIIHVDNNEAMNERAKAKKEKGGLTNLDIVQTGIEAFDLAPNSVQGLLSVHALYTFPNPADALQKMYTWLKPNGIGVLVDPGRVVNVVNWQLAIGWHLVSKYGLFKTLEIFREGRPVSQQNRYIRNMQCKGQLWTHQPEEFRQAVSSAGFEIIESRTCFRGLSDLAIVTKK